MRRTMMFKSIPDACPFSAVGQIKADQLLVGNAGFFRLLFEVLGHVGIQADGYLLFEPGGIGILYAL